MSSGTCGTCIYWTGHRPAEWKRLTEWWRRNEDRDRIGGHDLGHNTGACHRFPPRGGDRQPTTEEQDWCGEHKSTPEAGTVTNGGFGEDGPW